MAGESKERADQEVITNLALGQSPTDAAAAAGVGRSTVSRRLEELAGPVVTIAMDSC